MDKDLKLYRSSREIRNDFLKFFENKGHKILPSAPLASWDDPSLLFVNSGMAPFKKIFLGENPQGWKKVATAQRCLRVSGKHNDLEDVGLDGRHHTFFEMLGNWSFGDYGKKEAIMWSWELLTGVWRLPPERLWVTVYKDDDEAEDIWVKNVGLPRKRVLRFEKENFWEMGSSGPCGPSSEIHFDFGDLNTQDSTYNHRVYGINGENDRYIEIWNLVFMEQERQSSGNLLPLKEKHVDTGAGFERLCAVLQGVSSNYETDVFQPILDAIALYSGVPYVSGPAGKPHRVIADHLRALVFAIGDGILPSHENRGYVMRRILRRACRFAHKLGQKEPFLHKLVPTITENFGDVYDYLLSKQDFIAQVLYDEESRFLKTLDSGLARLEKRLQVLKEEGAFSISGAEVFLFHDTYGFPTDLTRLVAREAGLDIDEKGFEAHMAEQKNRAKKEVPQWGDDSSWEICEPGKDTVFVGYERLEAPFRLRRWRRDGDQIYLVLDQTPFYCESGGQVGDSGILKIGDDEIMISRTFSILGMTIHQGQGPNPKAIQGHGSVDRESRRRSSCHHSATHLLHEGLRRILGHHVQQKGSYVGPDRLRLDVTHHAPLTQEEKDGIENWVQEQIIACWPVSTRWVSVSEAKALGALALFEEKYGEKARLLNMGPSLELCGGTHVGSTGELGVFCFLKEQGLSAGIRRIEALAGPAAWSYLKEQNKILNKTAQICKTSTEDLGSWVEESLRVTQNLKSEMGILKKQLWGFKLQSQMKAAPEPTIFSLTGLATKTDTALVGHLISEALEKTPGIFITWQNDFGEISIAGGTGERAIPWVEKILEHFQGKGGGKPGFMRGTIKDSSVKEEDIHKIAYDLWGQRLHL